MVVYVCRFRVKCHFTLINISLVIKGITTAHSFMYALPILIVIIGSLALALYMSLSRLNVKVHLIVSRFDINKRSVI